MVDISFKSLERAPQGQRPATMKHDFSSGNPSQTYVLYFSFPSASMLKPTATERLGRGGEGLKEATRNQARTKKGRRSKLLRFGFEGK